MERWHRADLALACFKCEPPTSGFCDAFFDAEKCLRRRAAEANQDVRIGKLDLPHYERQTDLPIPVASACRRLPGGRQGTILAMYTEVRSNPIAASMRSSNLPDRPTNGRPSMSSSRPGASPTSITRASGFPSAKTSRPAVDFSAQPSNLSRMARSSSRVFASFAAARACMTASSGAGGAAGGIRPIESKSAGSAAGRAGRAAAAGSVEIKRLTGFSPRSASTPVAA